MPTMTALEEKLAKLNNDQPEPASAPAPVLAPEFPKLVTPKKATVAAKAKLTAAERQAEVREKEKVHIGAWLPKGFKRGLLLVRAETGDDVQTIIARALNKEFRTHGVPEVK